LLERRTPVCISWFPEWTLALEVRLSPRQGVGCWLGLGKLRERPGDVEHGLHAYRDERNLPGGRESIHHFTYL
jgi:hypothetical protein